MGWTVCTRPVPGLRVGARAETALRSRLLPGTRIPVNQAIYGHQERGGGRGLVPKADLELLAVGSVHGLSWAARQAATAPSLEVWAQGSGSPPHASKPPARWPALPQALEPPEEPLLWSLHTLFLRRDPRLLAGPAQIR